MEHGFVEIVRTNKKEGMVVVEVGCFDGATSRGVVPHVKECNGQFIVIDWFRGTIAPGWETHNKTNAHYYSEDPNKPIHVKNLFMMNMHGYEDIYKIIEGKSEEVYDQLEDESVDILFIDADHSYLGVKRDIELYMPKVKKGGILCGHDFDDTTPDFSFAKACCDLDDNSLAQDFIPVNGMWIHPGVAKAVFDKFCDKISRHPIQVWSIVKE